MRCRAVFPCADTDNVGRCEKEFYGKHVAAEQCHRAISKELLRTRLPHQALTCLGFQRLAAVDHSVDSRQRNLKKIRTIIQLVANLVNGLVEEKELEQRIEFLIRRWQKGRARRS
jgi:hypothetical protein